MTIYMLLIIYIGIGYVHQEPNFYEVPVTIKIFGPPEREDFATIRMLSKGVMFNFPGTRNNWAQQLPLVLLNCLKI